MEEVSHDRDRSFFYVVLLKYCWNYAGAAQQTALSLKAFIKETVVF